MTPWTAALQASLSLTIIQGSPKFMSVESVMLSNHHILLPSIFPRIRVFSNESAVCGWWTKHWRRTLRQTKYLFRARQSKMIAQRKRGRTAPNVSDLNYSKGVQRSLGSPVCLSAHTLFPSNTHFTCFTTFHLFAEIPFSKADEPGPCQLSVALAV